MVKSVPDEVWLAPYAALRQWGAHWVWMGLHSSHGWICSPQIKCEWLYLVQDPNSVRCPPLYWIYEGYSHGLLTCIYSLFKPWVIESNIYNWWHMTFKKVAILSVVYSKHWTMYLLEIISMVELHIQLNIFFGRKLLFMFELYINAFTSKEISII